MRGTSTRAHLRGAAESIAAARRATTSSETGEYLAEVERLLTYHAEGSDTDPEAMIYPAPGALDTVQRRLSEEIDAADGEVAEHLENARAELIQAIIMLDERMNDGRSTASRR